MFSDLRCACFRGRYYWGLESLYDTLAVGVFLFVKLSLYLFRVEALQMVRLEFKVLVCIIDRLISVITWIGNTPIVGKL